MRGEPPALAAVRPFSSYHKLLLAEDDGPWELRKSPARSTLSLRCTWVWRGEGVPGMQPC